MDYANEYPEATNLTDYRLLYWLIFIYFSFQGIDELIEMYAAFMKRQKGALALLFELNYFLGLGIAIYLNIFILRGHAQLEANIDNKDSQYK